MVKNILPTLKCDKIKSILVPFVVFLGITANCQNWESIGTGFWWDTDASIEGDVFSSINMGDTLLYLNGYFSICDDQVMNGICAYDGSSFYPLDCGYGCPNDTLPTGGIIMAEFQNMIWARDNSNYFGQNNEYRDIITAWNGEDWVVPFSGAHDQNIDLVGMWNVDGNLYICTANGDTLNGTYTDGMLKYNGESFELLEGLGFDESIISLVRSVCYFQDKLYIGGNFLFYDVDGIQAMDIAYYDQFGWHALSNPILGDSDLSGITVFQNELYAHGIIERSAGNPGQGIMKWNGTEWSDLGTGIVDNNRVVSTTFVTDSVIWLGGNFNEAGGVNCGGLGAWDGEKWCTTGSEFSYLLNTVFGFQGELYVSAGIFVDNISMNGLVRWIGDEMLQVCGEGVSIQEKKISYHIFPNPVTDVITISGLQPSSITSITIFDSVGRLVEIESNQFQVNMSGQAKVEFSNYELGVYFLELILDNQRSMWRVVKK